MSDSKDTEAQTLMAFLPWLERDEAIELLNNFGGKAESVMEHLNAVSSAADVSSNSKVVPEASSKAEPKVERHFVGGGPSSGQAVLGGDEAGSAKSVVESVFDKARRNELERDSAGLEEEGVVRMFAGRGRRLGHTTMESPFISSSVPHQRTVAVVVYRNGYRVDDGPLQQADTEDGVAFFRALESGVVPPSLSTAYPNTDITVKLSDCTDQDYKPPAYVPFAGEGCRLSVPAAPNPAEKVSGDDASSGTADFAIHEGEETVKIAIVNLLGERKEFTVNPHRHTVADVFLLAKQAQPASGLFKLVVREVPPRPLADKSLTIDAAKLRNAAIMMRPV